MVDKVAYVSFGQNMFEINYDTGEININNNNGLVTITGVVLWGTGPVKKRLETNGNQVIIKTHIKNVIITEKTNY